MRIWTRWVLVNIAGEVVGFGGAAALGVAVSRVIAELEGVPQVVAALARVVAVGTFEGACVGVAQWLALKTIVRGLSGRTWVLATVLGAIVAWAVGMAIGTHIGDAGGGGEPSWPLLLAGSAGIGALAGTLLAGPQSLVLRRVLPGSGWWVAAHALAWAVGMLVAFGLMSMIDERTPPLVAAAIGAATGLCMGGVVAAITGLTLVWLVRRAANSTPAKPQHAPNMVRWSGAAGVVAALFLLLTAPLFIMLGTPPPVSDAGTYADYLTRISRLALATKIIDTLYIVGFIVFLAGIRDLIRSRGAEYEWVVTVAFAGGLASSVMILMGDVLGAAAAIDTYSAPDPVVIRALTEATLPAFGAIGLTMTAVFLVPSSWGILATRTLPRWTGWMGYAVAVLTLLAAGTIFGGNDFLNTTIWGGSTSAGWYSYSYSIAGAALEGWLLVVGTCMFRTAPPTRPRRPRHVGAQRTTTVWRFPRRSGSRPLFAGRRTRQ